METAKWVWHLFFMAAGLFFLLFGVYLLIAAYQLKDPFHFIMTFFASSLIILISLTIVVGLTIRVVQAIRQKGREG